MQAVSALACGADWLLTRNTADFGNVLPASLRPRNS